MKEFIYKGVNAFEIKAYKWEVENPKACIQIIHGMGEHAKRYNDFALFLNKHSYSVYANDHRGHGKTLKEGEHAGEIGENGFELMVEDEFILTQLIKAENENKELYVLGHSMGSFILQEYLIRYSHFINKGILSGSCGKMRMDLSFGILLAFIEMKLKKKISGSKIIDFLTFRLYSLHFLKEKRRNAWLNRNVEEVEKYNKDKECGNIFPAQFYYYLYSGIKKLQKKERIEKINKNISLYIFSGDRDPVGKMGKGVKRLYKAYKDTGIKNVSLKLYPDGRHEMLNEINKLEVYEDFLKFIEK